MRTPEQLIRSALGDANFSLQDTHTQEMGAFRLFKIQLPSQFRHGIPPDWNFAILNWQKTEARRTIRKQVLSDALSIIDHLKLRINQAQPLVFLSDHPGISLAAALPAQQLRVFALDANDLPGRQDREIPARLSPLLLAVKRALSREDLALALSPYQPTLPVQDWRFFGRRKELTRLTTSDENFVVVGGRRKGKTSLLKQARHELQRMGRNVVFSDVQHCGSETEIVEKLVRDISPRDILSPKKRTALTGEKLLLTAIRRAAGDDNLVLIIDEIGTAIEHIKGDQWRVIGILRSCAQSGKVRIIASAFQEFFHKQREDFSGPWVNFATTMRLQGFSLREIDEFVIQPLALWSDVADKNALRQLVVSAIGTHPYFLQYFCQSIFTQMFDGNNRDIFDIARRVALDDILPSFADAIEEVYYRLPSSTIRYVFLLACHQAYLSPRREPEVRINDDWLQKHLASAGISTTTSYRRTLLETLEVRGLTEPVAGNYGEQRVICPIVYRFIARAEPNVDRLLAKYRTEMEVEFELSRTPSGFFKRP